MSENEAVDSWRLHVEYRIFLSSCGGKILCI